MFRSRNTLISFIGKGRVDKNIDGSAYQKTVYDFGSGCCCETSCFADAVRRSGKYAFDQVIFIGTPTSSWSALLENIPGEDDLCLELWERESNRQELDDSVKGTLTEALCRIWGKPVRLLLNPPQLLEENAEEIFDTYVRELLESGDDILLDITHSFRWMPILLTSALSFKDAFRSGGSQIQIIYGELGEGKKVSPVRCLDVLLRERKIADAIALFFQKFEAEPLASLLKPYWPSGMEAVKKLGMYIQGNLFLPLLFNCSQDEFPVGDPLKQLNNAFSDFSEAGQPAWVSQVCRNLRIIHKKLTVGDPPDRLCELAKLLADRNLYGQAIMAVCMAAEHSLAIAYGLKKFPDFDTLRSMKKCFLKASHKKTPAQSGVWNQQSGSVKNGSPGRWLADDISEMRNLIAHGGLCNDHSNPSPEALPDQYRRALSSQNELQSFLKNCLLPPFQRKKQNHQQKGK